MGIGAAKALRGRVFVRAGQAGLTAAMLAWMAGSASATPFVFTPGDLVVTVEGNGSNTAAGGTTATGNTGADANTYVDNQAAPLTLYEFTTTGTNQVPVATLELPTTASGNNSAISGEYGSSSEGGLQLTGNGQYLTLAGYGVNPATYNSNSDLNGGSLLATPTGTALAQSCSLSDVSKCGGVPQVSRVIAVVGADGSVDTSTVLYNVDNENNPRSVYSATGKSFYLSGQGSGNPGETGAGTVFIPSVGPGQTAVPITGQDASKNTVSQDTRDVQVYNNTLYVSTGTKQGAGNARGFVGTLGTPPATSVFNGQNGPTMLPGFGNTGGTGKQTISAITTNGVNSAGQMINLSPQNFFFANANTLYVADDGAPKNDSTVSSGKSIGDGGLQKWSLSGGIWSLDYTLSLGLSLVANTSASGTTGLYGLTGEDVTINGVQEVELFATNYTINDTDPTYLFGIADFLNDMNDPSADGSFVKLAAAPADSNFKGVAFAPVALPEAPSLAFLAAGFAGLGLARRRQRTRRA